MSIADEDQSKTVQAVCDVITDVFGLAPGEVGPSTVQQEVPEWDSLGHLNLMLAIEEAFDVSFSIDEMPKLVSVEAIADKVRAK